MEHSPIGANAPKEDERVRRFSFWKPDPIPPRNAAVLSVNLHSLGKLETVTEKLFDVPRMTEVPMPPWDEKGHPSVARLRWQVEEGVILNFRIEEGPPRPGEVLTIEAASAAADKTFYRLYVQLFEQFGVTVLDERSHDFLTPRQFRSKLAG